MTFDRSKNALLASWWWTIDRFMLLSIALIVGFGVIMVTTASPAIAERIGLDGFYFVKRQLIFLSVGVVCMVVLSHMPIVTIRRIGTMGFLFGIVVLLLVWLIGIELNGAKRWISILGISLQPSEFVKPFFAVFTAWMLSEAHSGSHVQGLKIAILGYLTFVGLLVMQPDFGMTVVVSVVWAGQMFIAGLSMVWVVVSVILAIIGLLCAYIFLPHVARRIDSFLDGGHGEAGYQVKKSLEAFYNGGLVGKGPGEGVIKQALPDSHTDFIFAVVGEEMGIIACMVMVFLYGFIVLRGLKRMITEEDLFVVYAVSGLVMLFGIQSMVNMGVALNLLPTKGMTLPFISYGGSSVLAVCITMGMMLALTRRRFRIALNHKPAFQMP